MPKKNQLPYLLQLLDDDTPLVRDAILKELSRFGPKLEGEIAKLKQPLDENQKEAIQFILHEHKKTELCKNWGAWYHKDDDYEKLESALGMIAEYLNGKNHGMGLKTYLDFLASEYLKTNTQIDAFTLTEFIFHEKKIKGVASLEYYDPQNSNLIYVIEQKKGIPISLVLILMLVGARVGITIEGCNYPGHFLGRTIVRGKVKLIDCFNGGVFIDEESVLKKAESENTLDIVHAKADAETIISRVLRNLIRAFQEQGDQDEEVYIRSLLESLEAKQGQNWL